MQPGLIGAGGCRRSICTTPLVFQSELRQQPAQKFPSLVCCNVLDGDDALSTMATHILFESASGYAIFEVKLKEEVGAMTKAAQDSIKDLAKFGKMVSLMSFSPFKSAGHALENANDISEGEFPGLEVG